jgi:hypothetical protein
MGRRRALAIALTALVAATVSPALASADTTIDTTAVTPPVSFSAAFGAGARLGHTTSVAIRLRIGTALPPVTELRILTPGGLDLSTTELGVTACRSSAAEVREVLNPIEHNRCPANSLMAEGYATAGLLLSEERTILSEARIELHSGTSVDDKPGLLLTADAYNPARMQLTYAGYLYIPPSPFGVGLAIRVPQIPRLLFGSPVAMSSVDLVVGGSSIVYHRRVRGRNVAYHPGGVPLPTSCVPGQFRFRTILRFADGSRRSADAVVPCPAARAR